MSSPSQLVDAWNHEDPDLLPCEKETTIRFAKDEDLATIHTDEPGIGRRLIAHPESTISELTVRINGEGSRRHVAPEDVRPDDAVVGLRCKLPVGALSVKHAPRKSNQHANVVSNKVFEEVEA